MGKGNRVSLYAYCPEPDKLLIVGLFPYRKGQYLYEPPPSKGKTSKVIPPDYLKRIFLLTTLNGKESEQMTTTEIIRTNLRRYTFESPKIKKWVEKNSSGKVLNLFAGKTLLDLDEVRNDMDRVNAVAEYHMDCVDFVMLWEEEKFDTIILDPPYALRKAMEMYNGNYTSRFKMLADVIPNILAEGGKVISFGYHSTFLGKVRGFDLEHLCVFAHGGAQHCTIAIIEAKE